MAKRRRPALAVAAIAAALLMDSSGQRPAAAPAQINVTGYVRDESGRPVSGAQVRVISPSARNPSTVGTDASGTFSATVPSGSRVSVSASHPDFGLQYTGGADIRGSFWTGYQYVGTVPTGAIDLRLRRGVILHGRVIDPSGRPFARESIFVVPAYIGSSPSRNEAATDEEGRFKFERMVLSKFVLVPHGLDFRHPRVAGDYLRIAQATEGWLAAASTDSPIELQLQAYTLVTLTLDVAAMRTPSVQVWTRGGPDSYRGSAMYVEDGRVRTIMELGVEYQLWVVPGTGMNMSQPWTRDMSPQWTGAPRGPFTLRIGG